jgi:hypothetical protein
MSAKDKYKKLSLNNKDTFEGSANNLSHVYGRIINEEGLPQSREEWRALLDKMVGELSQGDYPLDLFRVAAIAIMYANAQEQD